MTFEPAEYIPTLESTDASTKDISRGYFREMVEAGMLPKRGSPTMSVGPDAVRVPAWTVDVAMMLKTIWPGMGGTGKGGRPLAHPSPALVRRLCGDRSFRRACFSIYLLQSRTRTTDAHPLKTFLTGENTSEETEAWRERKLPWEGKHR